MSWLCPHVTSVDVIYNQANPPNWASRHSPQGHRPSAPSAPPGEGQITHTCSHKHDHTGSSQAPARPTNSPPLYMWMVLCGAVRLAPRVRCNTISVSCNTITAHPVPVPGVPHRVCAGVLHTPEAMLCLRPTSRQGCATEAVFTVREMPPIGKMPPIGTMQGLATLHVADRFAR